MAFLKDLFPRENDAQENSRRQISTAGTSAEQVTAQAGFPLAMAKTGEQQRVTAIRGKDDVRRFLGSLGFAEGAEVMLISEMNGNVIVNVKGTRVAVSKIMAMRVYVA